MSIHIFFYIGIADAGLEVVEERFDQSFAFSLFKAFDMSIVKLGSVY